MTDLYEAFTDDEGDPVGPLYGAPQQRGDDRTATFAADDPRILALLDPPPTLAELVAELKALREAKAGLMRWEHGGQEVLVQTDRDSRINILGAKELADMAIATGQPFAEDWTLADNAKLPLDAAGMIALAVAAGQHVAACHDRYDSLRSALLAAPTIESARDIDLTTGWPASCA